MGSHRTSAHLELALAVGLFAAPAGAQQGAERALADVITVANADECLEAATLAEGAHAWLGRETVDARVNVLVEVGEGGATANVIAMRDGAHVAVRRFDALPRACADRRAVVSLAAALAIDAMLLDVLSRAETAAPAVADEPAEEAPRPPRPSPFALEVSAGGGVLIGAHADVAAIGSVAASLRIDDVVRIDAAAFGTSIGSIALGSGAVDVALVAGQAAACVLQALAPVELAACGGIAVGAAMAQGRGFARDRAVELPWAAVTTHLEGAVWLAPPFALWLGLDGMFAFARPRLEVIGGGGETTSSHTLSAFGAAVTLGVRARFR
jgi:hypothetical protein